MAADIAPVLPAGLPGPFSAPVPAPRPRGLLPRLCRGVAVRGMAQVCRVHRPAPAGRRHEPRCAARYLAADSSLSDWPFPDVTGRRWGPNWASARVSSWWTRPTRGCTRWAWPGSTAVGRLGGQLPSEGVRGLRRGRGLCGAAVCPRRPRPSTPSCNWPWNC